MKFRYQKNLILILVISGLIFNSGCATILNSKYQKVRVEKESEAIIYVNGEMSPNDIIKVQRDGRIKQVIVKRDGFYDAYYSLGPLNVSNLSFFSLIPFGAFFLVPVFVDAVHPKAKNHQFKLRTIGRSEKVIQKNDSTARRFVLKTTPNFNSTNFQIRSYYNYKQYKQNGYHQSESENLKDYIINNKLSKIVNQELIVKGYSEEASGIFDDNYLGNVFLHPTIDNMGISLCPSVNNVNTGVVKVHLKIKWEVTDYYGDTLLQYISSAISGDHVFGNLGNAIIPIDSATESAFRNATIDCTRRFINSNSIDSILHDTSAVSHELSNEKLIIPQSGNNVSNLREAVKSTVTILGAKSHGSGFIISKTGHIVTNYHVLENDSNCNVVLNDASKHKAQVIRVSKAHDLALLKINGENLTPFDISDSNYIELADEIYAIGTPSSKDLSQTISKGIVSGFREGKNGNKLIQTDASVNFGNSGGPLVSKNGLLIGIITTKLIGVGVEGVAFAIPVEQVFETLNLEYEQMRKD